MTKKSIRLSVTSYNKNLSIFPFVNTYCAAILCVCVHVYWQWVDSICARENRNHHNKSISSKVASSMSMSMSIIMIVAVTALNWWQVNLHQPKNNWTGFFEKRKETEKQNAILSISAFTFRQVTNKHIKILYIVYWLIASTFFFFSFQFPQFY